MTPPTDPDPLAPARDRSLAELLSLLTELDGSEEADVVRNALALGVSPSVAHEECQREVERRLMRRHAFYDHLRE